MKLEINYKKKIEKNCKYVDTNNMLQEIKTEKKYTEANENGRATYKIHGMQQTQF